jgi:ABC-type lipoprotein release transport system permease subunit
MNQRGALRPIRFFAVGLFVALLVFLGCVVKYPACLVPAARAARTAPAIVLREE